MPKFFKYSSEKYERSIGSKLHNLYTRKTTAEFKEDFERFKKEYNNVIHQKLIEKYLGNIEALYKYSVNIRLLLFKHSANVYLYDRIRVTFNNNRNYISDLNEIYETLGNIEN